MSTHHRPPTEAAAGDLPSFRLLKDGVPLYRADPDGDASRNLYYGLVGSPDRFPPTLAFAAAWSDHSGGFVFVPDGAVVTDAAATLAALDALLQPHLPGRQWLAWIPDPNPGAEGLAGAVVCPIAKSVGPGNGTVKSGATLAFADLALQIAPDLVVAPRFDGPAPGLDLVPNTSGASGLTLQRTGSGQASLPLPNDAPLRVAFAGSGAGAWSFALAPDRGTFFSLFSPADGSEQPPASAEIRYFAGSAGQMPLRFPVLLGDFPDPRAPVAAQLPLSAVLDPLRPTDAARSRFAFDLDRYGRGGPVLPVGLAFRSTAGHTLHVTPQTGAGFSLAWRPGPDGGREAYLTPAGPFAVTEAAPKTAALAGPPLANGALQLMCGLFGSEFLLLAVGDKLDFTGDRPADATGFVPARAQRPERAADGGLLSDICTTNWVQVVPGPNGGTTFPGPIKQSFCAQAIDAVYYQSAAPKDYPFPIAVGARLADLSRVADGQVFPMAPYGDVYASDPDQGFENPNPGVSAATFSAYEVRVLSPARRAAVALDRCLGPLFFDMATLDALSGGYVRTPQGLLVGLNDGPLTSARPAGTWRELLLARSPQKPEQVLRFRAGTAPSGCPAGRGPFEVVSPFLSTALMHPSPFVVVADPSDLGAFDNRIQLGEYAIEIAVSNRHDGATFGDNCVLIFKLAAGRALADLAADPDAWTEAARFVGEGAVPRIGRQIAAFEADARQRSREAQEKHTYDYFADFLARIDDPNWTGIIALNAPLDLQALPPDVQMLLSGMRSDEPLRCHHFGITANAADLAALATDPLGHSALFGLIYYEADFQTPKPDADYDFQTLKLDTLFDNSTIKHFASRIAYSTRTLFGDPAKLSRGGAHDLPDTNTIVIDGALQVQGQTTSIVFATSERRVFTFPTAAGQYRALSGLVVGHAGLAPVTEVGPAKAGDPVTLTAAFTIDGAAGFTTRPQTGSSVAVDLFSFGFAQDGSYDGGLGYARYAFLLVSHIPPSGRTPAPAISLDLSGLQLDPTVSAPRDQSLVATLPLKMLGFAQNPDVAALKAVSVTGIGLDGVTPRFAVRLQLVLGTLGGLSNSGPLDGELLLGWRPGESESAADAVGLLFAPPSSMTSGTFRLQGVIPTQYGAIELQRPTLYKSYVYVLVLRDVLFTLGAFPLYIPQTGERSLTFFGHPSGGDAGDDDGGGIDLAWFLGEPDLSGSAEPKRQSVATTSMTLNVVPAVYVTAGLHLHVDPQSSAVVQLAIMRLSQVPLSTTYTLEQIAEDTVDFPVTYDPHAGVTVGIDLAFGPLTFQMVFSDPYVYGALLGIAPAPDNGGKNGKNGKSLVEADGGGKGENKGILSSLRGFVLEIAYRKISDDLGAWSGRFTYTKPVGTDDYCVILPTIGLVVYTNSDFRIDIGWPFTPDGSGWSQPLAVQFSIEGIPVRAAAGLYLAKLRSADAPYAFGDKFAVIWRFGLGLSFGINKYVEKGPMELMAGVIAFVTFEGFLASEHGSLTEDGVDYMWFAGQLGVEAYFNGGIDLKVIKAYISISATLVLQIAYETKHATLIRLAFRVSIYVEFRILFVKVSFSFDADLDVLPPLSIGSGPTASVDGPDPLGVNQPLLRARAMVAPKIVPAEAVARLLAAGADERIDITLYFALQPTTVDTDDGTGAQPQAIAGLVMELLPDSDAPDDFSKFLTALGLYLLQAYAGSGTLAQQLARIATKLDGGAFDDAVWPFLEDGFRFTILAPGDLSAQRSFVFFPMLPPLALTYDGRQIPFDAPALPPGYPQAVAKYFDQLAQGLKTASAPATAAAEVPRSAAAMVCADMVVLQAKQLIAKLQDVAHDHPDFSFAQALSSLGGPGFANLAGFMSRFALHGLRLPAPGSEPFGKDLIGIYQLTGQQVALARGQDGWVTQFRLGFAGPAPAWIAFGADHAGTSVAGSLDPHTVLTAPVRPTRLTAGGLAPLPPVKTLAARFYLARTYAWTQADGTVADLRPFSDMLMRRLAGFFAGGGTGATAALTQVAGNDGSDPAAAAAAADDGDLSARAGLLVPLSLRRIAGPDGKPLASVFRLIGTDDATRALLDALFAAKAYGGASLAFLAATGSSAFRSSAKDASIVLAKANLSTLSEPPTAAADGTLRSRSAAEAPPVSARLADAAAFLELVWEVSIVHADGFYLHVDGLSDDAFASGDAQIALLATFGPAGPRSALDPWHNCFVLGTVPDKKKGAVVAAASDPSGPWTNASPAYRGGLVGFRVLWPTPPAVPALDGTSTDPQKAAYAEALYSLLQYRIVSVAAAARHVGAILGDGPALPTNWSLPVGPNQAKPGETWTFVNAVAVAPLLGKPNRYAGVGTSVGFSIRLLDIYGNALPQPLPLAAPVVYNDRLVPVHEWPGVRAYYAFGRRDEAVALTLLIDFDPLRLDAGALASDDKSVLAHARDAAALVLDQLTDPLQLADPASGVEVRTVLAAAPLDRTADGASLRAVLTGFVAAVLAYLDAAIAGRAIEPPEPIRPVFSLDRSHVGTLPTDIFELTVDLALFRAPDTLDRAIAAAVPGVARVASSLGAAVSVAPGDLAPEGGGPDMSLGAFAQAFEAAWYGFDGAEGQLKLAQGLSTGAPPQGGGGSAPLPSGSAPPLWCARLSGREGIAAAFPNAAEAPKPSELPCCFAPRPLSTQLLARTVKVRLYKTAWTGSGGDVLADQDHAFSGVDLDIWGGAFTAAVESLFAPQLATAAATLDPARYADLAALKEALADGMMDGLAAVLAIPGQTVVAQAARERFRQALLQSLVSDYTLASVVQLPATVSTAGQDEPKAPPLLFGKVSDAVAQQHSPNAFTLSSAKLAVASGTSPLTYLVSARDPAAHAYLDLKPDFDVAFLEHDFEPDRKYFGYEPSSWLGFVVPAYRAPDGKPTGKQALNFSLGRNTVPIPLRAYPAMPVIVSQAAAVPTTIRSIAEALLWSYGFDVVVPTAAQDELTLVVLVNDPPSHQPTPRAERRSFAAGAMGDDPVRPPPSDLFEALARFAFEYPQIAPHLAEVPAAAFGSGDAAVAKAALARVAELIRGAARTWKAWVNPGSAAARAEALRARANRLAAPAGLGRASWTYVVDFAEKPDLRVTRGIGTTAVLPPWPDIDGFVAPPASDKATDTYRRAEGQGPAVPDVLRFTLANLFDVGAQSAHVMASVTRNNVVPPGLPAGTTVDPAFVYTTPFVELKDPVVPYLAAGDTLVVGQGSATLAAAVDVLFAPFADGPAVPGIDVGSMRLQLGLAYHFALAQSDDQTVSSTVPIFLGNREITFAEGADGFDAFKRSVVAGLSQWAALTRPSQTGASIGFSITLFAEIGDRPLPLVKLDDVRIPVPPDDPVWWG